ncbi:hypothetical protein [Actinoplanes subglobosus]|uniref:Uncharacterized protein n=1 Tax=Actinoplanes subglobosus TaxID=1547892 RepID=A0ABV8JAC8_9ACTN
MADLEELSRESPDGIGYRFVPVVLWQRLEVHHHPDSSAFAGAVVPGRTVSRS